MPDGLLLTAPEPLPDFDTVSENCWMLKVAVTAVAALTATVQVPVPEQPPPLQPAKTDPDSALAVSVTAVPELKLAAQVVPQLIPAGEELTVPDPVPDFVTVRVTPAVWVTWKDCVTCAAAS